MFLSQAAIDAVFGTGAGHESPTRRPGQNNAPAGHAHTRAEAFRAVPNGPTEPHGVVTPTRAPAGGHAADAPAR